jgi:dienelactone hydrolase
MNNIMKYSLSFLALLYAVAFTAAIAACSSPESETITFKSAQFEITCDLQLPEGKGPHPAIIVVHGSGKGTRRYYRMMRERFISTGYATLIWDKPGFGESKGKYTEGKVLSERAGILLKAMATLKDHSAIDPDRIGVWGVSQAGYLIPIALREGADIAFAIFVGAAGENGIQQTAYFVGQQMICEGATEEHGAEADSLAAGVMAAKTYDEYVACGRPLLEHYPLVKAIDFMAGILPEERWSPRDPTGDSYFNPMEIIEQTSIPILAFFGELDKNVDPKQGAEAYRDAFAKGGSKRSKVIIFPGVDHDMVPSETGCMRERYSRSSWKPDEGYLDAMVEWLSELQ